MFRIWEGGRFAGLEGLDGLDGWVGPCGAGVRRDGDGGLFGARELECRVVYGGLSLDLELVCCVRQVRLVRRVRQATRCQRCA